MSNLPFPLLEEALESPETLWNALGFEEDELVFNHKGTMVQTQHVSETAQPVFAAALPQFVLSGTPHQNSTSPVQLDLREALGEGGMGLVQLALQVPLRREVAVKRLREGRESPLDKETLLREAWVTGALEHPNIIPVHALGCDEDGSPMFVMKRVEGVPWSEVMHNPNHPLRREHQEDHLAWNLDVLMQVCNAVHFAHSRGILHRDLKPDNVMIGAFGEVYLLDWGIAVKLTGKSELPIPRVTDITTIVGTPAYLAPEMVRIDVHNINEKTDVYLLGGLLHEILMGTAPHVGVDLREVLFKAAMSTPHKYKASIPADLVAVVHKAMHLHPQYRFHNAEELRQALATFLLHRESIRMTERGFETLLHLQTLLQSDSSKDRETHRLQIYSMFSETRFAFQQALQSWKQNSGAKEGLQRALQHIIRFEIGEGDYKAASLFYNTLDTPPPDLTEQMNALEKQYRAQQAELESFKQQRFDADLNVGKRTRSFIVLMLGLLALPSILLFGEWIQWFEFNTRVHVMFGLGFLAMIAFFTVWARESMMRTAINRKILGSIWLLGWMLLLLPLASWKLGFPARQSFALTQFLLALHVGVMAILVDLRMLGATFLFLLSFTLSMFFPRWLFEFAAFGNVAGVAWIAWYWQPEQWFSLTEEEKRKREVWREEERRKREET